MKHKHYDAIIGYANGMEIECEDAYGNWEYIKNPSWENNIEYRIKDKFAELKEAHKQGKTIEYYDKSKDKWFEAHFPSWVINIEYRINSNHPSYLWAASDGNITARLHTEEQIKNAGYLKHFTIKLLWSETYL